MQYECMHALESPHLTLCCFHTCRHDSSPFSPVAPLVSPFAVRAPTPSDPGAGADAHTYHLPSRQLWTQKSIGAAAREDMKRFAAMHSMFAGTQAWGAGSVPGSPAGAAAASAAVIGVDAASAAFVGSRGATPHGIAEGMSDAGEGEGGHFDEAGSGGLGEGGQYGGSLAPVEVPGWQNRGLVASPDRMSDRWGLV